MSTQVLQPDPGLPVAANLERLLGSLLIEQNVHSTAVENRLLLLVADILENGKANGEIDPFLPPGSSFHIVATILGFASARQLLTTPPSLRQLAENLVAGLRPAARF